MDNNELKREIESLKNRVTVIENLLNGPKQVDTSISKKMSLKEFLLEKHPSGDVQKTVAIAYYLENIEGNQSFNRGDIENGFRSAREKVPVNVSDKISMAAKNGYFMEDNSPKGNLKAWVLTNTGTKYVENAFNKN